MGSGPSIPKIEQVHRRPLEIVDFIKKQGGMVSEERCLKMLRDIRWMIILQMDAETYISNIKAPTKYRKILQWESYKKQEIAASMELCKRKMPIDEENMNECFKYYRQLYREMTVSCIPQKMILEPDEVSYFSNISIFRGKEMRVDTEFKDPLPPIEDVVEAFKTARSEGMDKNNEGFLRTTTEKMIIQLGKSIQTRNSSKPCMYEQELRRYEKELKRILKGTMNEDNCKSILIQYRKQLQICVFYLPSSDEDLYKRSGEIKGNGRGVMKDYLELTTADDACVGQRLDGEGIHIIPDDTAMFSEKDRLEMKKKDAAAQLRKQNISLLLQKMDDSARDKTEDVKEEEVIFLLQIYQDELKLLYNIHEEKDVPEFKETYLEEKLQSTLNKERTKPKPRDVKKYKETLETALDSDMTYDEDDSYQREEMIILDLELKRWQELMMYSQSACVEDQAKLGSDFDDSYRKESKMIQGITQAQAAIVDRVQGISNTSDNEVKVTTAQVIKEHVTECKEKESKYREFVHSQIKSARVMLEKTRKPPAGAIPNEESESDEEYIGEINRIEKELDDRYGAIVRIGQEMDESDEDIDSNNDEGRKQEGMKQLEENVEKIQQLVLDMRKVKCNVQNKINEGISEIKAEIAGLKQEFIVLTEEMKKLRSDLTKRNTNEIKKIYKKLVEKVEQFDRKRFQKLTSRRLSAEVEEIFRKIAAADREELKIFLLRIMTTQEQLIQQQTPRKPGLGTVLIRNAEDVRDFLKQFTHH